MGSDAAGAHEFFEVIREHRYEVNYRAFRKTKVNKFTYYFKLLFQELDCVPRKNMDSWLNAIADGFTINMNFVKPFMLQEANTLFDQIQLDPSAKENKNVFHFWLYLNKVYLSLFFQKYGGMDNILNFMTGFPIHSTRVVIVGQDPTRHVHSSGFAFHRSPCKSTSMLLQKIADEMNLFSKLSGNAVPQVYSDQLERGQRNGDLGGWINQGVLMINSKLTCAEANWNPLINYLLRYLSNNFDNLVFILVGNVAFTKSHCIDQSRHMVLKVYHPASYNYPNRKDRYQNGRDWNRVLPFINTNFYMLQKMHPVIDWHHINGKLVLNERLDTLKSFLLQILNSPKSQQLPPEERYPLYEYKTGTEQVTIYVRRYFNGELRLLAVKSMD